jgi:FMN-dependent NADH-azoreductase
MKTLLVVNSSGRVTRSVTRRLTARFAEGWLRSNPSGTVIERDVGLRPPSSVSEPWIAAAFADPGSRAGLRSEALRESEILIGEITSCDAIVLGVPIYNFGMPAQLKAYFDQIIRIGRTFAIDPQPEDPYRPLLASKPCIIVTAASEPALYPGGPLAHLNFLEPHLRTLWRFIGVDDVSFVRVVSGDATGPDAGSLAAAEAAIDELIRTVGAAALSIRPNAVRIEGGGGRHGAGSDSGRNRT